jgi:hypothetical protein
MFALRGIGFFLCLRRALHSDVSGGWLRLAASLA